jgi:hypothetical protein
MPSQEHVASGYAVLLAPSYFHQFLCNLERGSTLQSTQSVWRKWRFALVAALLLGAVAVPMAARGQGDPSRITFSMVRSAAAQAAGCLPGAGASVAVRSVGAVERMNVRVRGLPPNTEFDFFVIQVPNAPFGLAWYQGDIETNSHGGGDQTFVGRFNIETFIVAPGVAPAPVVHDQPPFPDASSNPATAPVHTFHLGLWFNDPADAVAAGCPGAVTPFNGDHNAGFQILSTRNFADDQGPLRQLGS